MSLKFMTNKTYLENINGLKNFEEFNINYDSNRDKIKQVNATFNSNGEKYHFEDSLQKFMNNMPISKNSIFDLLKKDLHEFKKNNTSNGDHSGPSKSMKFKDGETRKSSKGKYRANIGITSRGITSKLFDYPRETLSEDYTHKIHETNKNSKKHKHFPKHGRKYTHKHERKLKLITK